MPAMSSATVYLVTGANRGLGLGLVTELLTIHADAFIYAGVRDPLKRSGLNSLEENYPGRISVIKYIAGDEESNRRVADAIKAGHGRVDTVIANAGVSEFSGTVLETPSSSFERQFVVNALGPITLFQYLHGLLKASSTPRFVPISTGAASTNGNFMKLPTGLVGYGASKSALNHITRKIHFENEWLIAFPLAPGAVETDMMGQALESDQDLFKGVFIGRSRTVPEASKALVSIIDTSSRENESGEFINVDGTKLPW